MEITRGRIIGAKKVVIYGPEGIGKSTFASHFPKPLFIDTEGSTKDMEVARLPRPSSWEYLLQEIQFVKENPDCCRSLIIDTVDWAEQLCVEHICKKHQKSGIEDFGYGTGYVFAKEEFGRFLNQLEDLIEIGVNVVLTAHAQIRKFEQPDELGAYDRWELKLGKKTSSQTSPLVKEWSDMLLFANYRTYSVAVDDKGKKHKAQGGKKVMYTGHHPCWDAKNRYGLPDSCDFDYGVIRNIIENQGKCQSYQKIEEKQMEQAAEEKQQVENKLPDFMKLPEVDADEEVDFHTGQVQKKQTGIPEAFKVPEYVPKTLRDLMEINLVSEEEIQTVVSNKGYFPKDTPIQNYPDEFINGVLVGAWKQVYQCIKDLRMTYEIPFN